MFWRGGDRLPMSGPDDMVSAGAAPAGKPPGWRRRRYVVDARYQFRAGILVGLTAVVLLVLLNASLIVNEPSTASAVGAAARPAADGQDRAALALLLLGSGVFVAGVILVGLLESHRTAGAAFAIRRAVDAIRDGHPEIRVRLRRRDHLQDLARSINRLAETIDSERTRRG
jgi:hypothetical protein